MPIHGYPGNIITASPTAPTNTTASGVWTLEQQLQAQAAGNWPMAATQISRSLRFNSADSAYLNRTPSGAGTSATIWTFSWWQKGVALTGSTQVVFGAESGGSRDLIRWDGSGSLEFVKATSTLVRVPTAKYRDPSAWYHFIINVSGATVGVYVNGVQVTAFSTSNNPSGSWLIGQANLHRIGLDPTGGDALNGYLTEINFIDGSALTPNSFGFFDNDGVWAPKQYTGPYGTNGFYLTFSDNSDTTATTLGKDYSGNGNNWTPNNFSVAAGAGNDSLVDSPTRYGTDTGAGGEVRGNYATWNPLDQASATIANGNLDTSAGAGRATFGLTTGKWYWEQLVVTKNDGFNNPRGGVAGASAAMSSDLGSQSNAWVMFMAGGANGGKGYNNSTITGAGSAFAANDIGMFAYDADSGKLWFGKNGSWLTGNPATDTTPFYSSVTAPVFPVFQDGSSSSVVNFGQRPFAYTAPSGFKALVTTNLPAPTIEKGGEYFNTVLYTGTGSTQSISGVGFQPDWLWIKSRSAAANHALYDVIRGGTNALRSNTTGAESQYGDAVITYQTDGFQIAGTNVSGVNGSSESLVAWNWKANGAGVSNTDGTITSTVSANTDSGFSIVTYTGNGTSGATIGHGLGVVPAMTIIKRRSNTETWIVWHTAFNSAQSNVRLQSTDAVDTNSPAMFNNTFPTSTLITLGNGNFVNTSAETYVCYAFASVAGYSAFGSYTGNGSTDGPFVYTGFRPAFVLVKRTDTGTSWGIVDDQRNQFNLAKDALFPNLSNAESSESTGIDMVSNGFKIRGTGSLWNASGGSYIFMAFAENPFKLALAR